MQKGNHLIKVLINDSELLTYEGIDPKMISEFEFFDIINNILEIDGDRKSLNIVISDHTSIQTIIAGPGTGKTTTIVLRILYLLFVEDIKPEAIIATTFTRKAASELQSRIQSWGLTIHNYLITQERTKIDLINFASIRIGTLDSIIKDFVNQLLVKDGINSDIISSAAFRILLKRHINQMELPELQEISDFYNEQFSVFESMKKNDVTADTVVKIVEEYGDKIIQNLVDPNLLTQKAERRIISVLQAVYAEIQRKQSHTHSIKNLFFLLIIGEKTLPPALIRLVFPSSLKLRENTFIDLIKDLRYIIIDEYQDTNLLQELTYLKIFDCIHSRNKGMTIVGDDDQSLYRFRGSHVEIFTQFSERFSKLFPLLTSKIEIFNLKNNYRSTQNIISFCNQYLDSFSFYKSMRYGDKPILVKKSTIVVNPPIIRISAIDQNALAVKVSKFVSKLLSNEFYIKGIKYEIDSDLQASNISFLSNSVRERIYIKEHQQYMITFAGKLRRKLENNSIQVFNPRGEDPTENRVFQNYILTLILMIDFPLLTVKSLLDESEYIKIMDQKSIFLKNNLRRNKDLKKYLYLWRDKKTRLDEPWKSFKISFLSLVYNLLTYFPELLSDPVGIIYVSTIVQQVEDLQSIDPSGISVIFDVDDPEVWRETEVNILNYILLPAIQGDINVDESLYQYIPENHLSFNTFHQAKGLEFPIVIVDVGSMVTEDDIDADKHWWDHLYYPHLSTTSTKVNHHLVQFSKFSPQQFDSVSDSYADVIRKFFVAYSRAQYVLVLVGTENAFTIFNDPTSKAYNVALGDTKDLHSLDAITLHDTRQSIITSLFSQCFRWEDSQ
ncbi:MAG: UvrD-helicase domain-containing protein [Candidatus Heimdallarchaeota archaeon]|nr:UvrD-helicase domain-containing protein [Candidatus Heimdallarchaeota archaeon]